MQFNLSLEKALLFAEKVLEIDNIQIKVKEKPLQTLNDIAAKFQRRIPFHNLHLVSAPPGELRPPSWSDIEQQILSQSGGLCTIINPFSYAFLRAVGYEADLVVSNLRAPNNHLIVLVNINGELFVFDPGMGYPTFDVTSLDFETESQEKKQSFCTYKFIRNGSTFARLHRHREWWEGSSTLYSEAADTNGWYKLYDFVPCATDLGAVESLFHNIYMNSNSFHSSLRATGYDDQGSAWGIKNLEYCEENDAGLLIRREKPLNEIKLVLQQRCPAVDKDILDRAVENWLKLQSK